MEVLARDLCSGLPAPVSASLVAWIAPHPVLGLGPPPPAPSCISPNLAALHRGAVRGERVCACRRLATISTAGQELGEETQSLGEGPEDVAADETPALRLGEVHPISNRVYGSQGLSWADETSQHPHQAWH